ncbi:MAG: response regulator [Microcoleaceae cyanobacterium]
MNYVQTEQLIQELQPLYDRKITGSLILSTPHQEEEGRLHFVEGQLLYMTSRSHRVRRWSRAIRKSCPNWKPQSGLLTFDSDTPWEYQLLDAGIADEQLTITQAKTVIAQVALEILFTLSNREYVTHQVDATVELTTDIYPGLVLSQNEIEPLLKKVEHLRSQWQTAGLTQIDPAKAPLLKQQVDSRVLSTWDKYLNGKLTLWDVAARLGKSVTSVTRALLPLIKRGLIQLRTVPDLPDPTFQLAPPSMAESNGRQHPEIVETTVTTYTTPDDAVPQSQPLIACIDDSPVVIQALKTILEPAGYRVMHLQDPVQALAQVAVHKPDLIFLDLIMPNANGYTVCQFLRNAPLFRNTPVIILTSQDNVIDRSRTLLAGATGFLGKPPKPKETLRMVRRHLPVGSTTKSSTDGDNLEMPQDFQF